MEEKYFNVLKEKLSHERLEHSLRVKDTALELGLQEGLEKDKLFLAALLHDIAKDMPFDEQLTIARKNGIITCQAEELQPALLHGPVGAWLCREELGIKDEEVLNAIRYHTTGNVNMNKLDIVIYLADLIEPGRTYKGADELRQLCARDIYQGLLFAFDCSISFVIKRKLLLHPLTLEARNWLLLKKFIHLEEKNGE